MIIYKCLFPNGKVYIGQTSRKIDKRIKEHLRCVEMVNKTSYNQPLYRAIRKYGTENIVWESIEKCSNSIELNEREKYWIKYYNSFGCNGYNLTDGGEGVHGHLHKEETKLRISNSENGENNTRAILSNEQVLEIVELSKHNIYSQVELSKKYHVTESTISRILSGIRWSSVTGIKYNEHLFKNA